MSNMQKIENDAHMKEKLAREKKDVNLEQEANDMILNSIKAKLAILQNMRQQWL